MSQPTIEDVRSFWNRHPLFTGEARSDLAGREFFVEHERVILEDCFAGRLDDFYFAVPAGGKVLDVGCGPGFWVREFSRRGFETHAVDLSERAVELARKSLEIFGLRAEVRTGNAESLPFEAAVFDHVNCQGVIHHTPDTEKCIREFHRVLRPGGTVCFSVYYRNTVLRNRWLFGTIKLLATLMRVELPGRGRDTMLADALSPEDLVRMYDGRENPIGKAFTRPEVTAMVEPWFEEVRIIRHFFPARALPIRLSVAAHRILHRLFGLMIVVRGRKPVK